MLSRMRILVVAQSALALLIVFTQDAGAMLRSLKHLDAPNQKNLGDALKNLTPADLGSPPKSPTLDRSPARQPDPANTSTSSSSTTQSTEGRPQLDRSPQSPGTDGALNAPQDPNSNAATQSPKLKRKQGGTNSPQDANSNAATQSTGGGPGAGEASGSQQDANASTADQWTGRRPRLTKKQRQEAQRQERGPRSTEPMHNWGAFSADEKTAEIAKADAVARTIDSWKRSDRELTALAEDAGHSGDITPTSLRERDVGLALERSGAVPGPIKRAAQKEVDFVDVSEQKWDVKSPNSYFPKNRGKGGFELEKDTALVEKSLAQKEYVMLDTRNMKPEDIAALKARGVELEWGDRVKWYSPQDESSEAGQHP